MISIVTAYYNRKPLFYETLKSITRSEYKDIEFIVVDDGSDDTHRLEDLVNEFPFIRIIRLERGNRWYINPCVPFNIGLREAQGDIIVLQNPECLYVHDVLTFIVDNLNNSKYISISTYALNPSLTSELPKYNNSEMIIEFFKSLPKQKYTGSIMPGWYNHPRYRPTYFHFCSAITRENMKKLNGFDERFAHGVGYDDDDEFVDRVKKLGLKLIIPEQVSVLHQYHSPVPYPIGGKNRTILNKKTKIETDYKVNTLPLWA